ncbi:MAG: trehalose-binding protein [Desulfovibrionaceae bacterium]|nr:trehalose-binding protein [Desulfovibrionaceae bacterium]
MRIGPYTHEEFMEEARKFHGYPAPGLIIGGYMVELARSHMPRGVLYDAISETTYCLPDAIQLLTPCTTGNGWLRILNLGLYAMSLYDKRDGRGVRVHLDVDKLEPYPAIRAWFLKTTPKKEQDADQLQEEIYEAGIAILSAQDIEVKPGYLGRRDKGHIVRCALCGEPHPAAFGTVCRSCQGESPYARGPGLSFSGAPVLRSVPVAEAVGGTALHDMTRIEPGVSKGPAVLAGQVISGGDVCRLQAMGRNAIYLDDQKVSDHWLHENEAAAAFGARMPGEGVVMDEAIREGKVNFRAARRGLLRVDTVRLALFNRTPDVMCASRHTGAVVERGGRVAASRAIPLYLSRGNFLRACSVLDQGPLFSVLPLRRAKVGILVTGTEVFRGIIEDRFQPVIEQKVTALDCEVVHALKVPDEADRIREGVERLLDHGADLIVTTAGLSVDPDDVTRKGLLDAGLDDTLYGMPLLPGAMSLVGRIRNGGRGAQVMGVPACALFHKTTAFDVLLPYVLADAPLSREFVAELGHGGLCLECRTCSYPKCAFAK